MPSQALTMRVSTWSTSPCAVSLERSALSSEAKRTTLSPVMLLLLCEYATGRVEFVGKIDELGRVADRFARALIGITLRSTQRFKCFGFECLHSFSLAKPHNRVRFSHLH